MKILVAVLNWGLGHASRSIPIIKALQQEGFEPFIASDGQALELLKKEFPEVRSARLPAYNIAYPKNGSLLKLHFFWRTPMLLRSIISEHREVRRLVRTENIMGIISDNRLGAFVPGIPSAYLTHQVKVLSGTTSFITSKLHQFFIRKFTECWVPDIEEMEQSLSGKMSHGEKSSIPVRYLGILSRFKIKVRDPKIDLLVLLSGPEPQRNLLEQKLLQELKSFSGRVLFIRGTIVEEMISETRGSMEIHNYLTGEALENAIAESRLVLSRSGYSTVMDLAAMEKKAFFIPTPGQFEQEYLAYRMQQQGIAPFCLQEEFCLEELQKVSAFSGFSGSRSRISLSSVFDLFKGE